MAIRCADFLYSILTALFAAAFVLSQLLQNIYTLYLFTVLVAYFTLYRRLSTYVDSFGLNSNSSRNALGIN